MVPIKFNEVELLLRQANVKLKRMQKSKTVDTAMVMSVRLFMVGFIKLLRYFRTYKPPEGAASVTFMLFDYKFWEATSSKKARILKPILNRKRYANLSRTFVALKQLNKNITPETEPVFFIFLVVFLLETYAILLFFATALSDPTFLNAPSVKQTVRTMLAFRRKMQVPFDYYDNYPDIPNRIDNAVASMKPFLGKNLRTLIAYNKKLV